MSKDNSRDLAKTFMISPEDHLRLVKMAERAAAEMLAPVDVIGELTRSAREARLRADRESKGLNADQQKVVDEMIKLYRSKQ